MTTGAAALASLWRDFRLQNGSLVRIFFAFRILSVVVLGFASFAASGQAPSPAKAPEPSDAAAKLPSFEVAAIRPNLSKSSLEGSNIYPQRYEAMNMSVADLIEEAYNVRRFQLSGGPEWLYSARFDIQARISDADYHAIEKLDKRLHDQKVHLMVRSLLVNRFKLRVSHQPREYKAFALVVAKGGPKLQPHGAPKAAKSRSPTSFTSFSGMVLTHVDSPLSEFTFRISASFDRPVVDMTGLKGNYDIRLNVPIAPEDDQQSAITSALKEFLGLTLEPRKAILDSIVVEHLEMPSPN